MRSRVEPSNANLSAARSATVPPPRVMGCLQLLPSGRLLQRIRTRTGTQADQGGKVMTIETLIKNLRPRRKVHGIAAALLPYREDGTIAVDAFQQHLGATQQAGLMNAVNMD